MRYTFNPGNAIPLVQASIWMGGPETQTWPFVFMTSTRPIEFERNPSGQTRYLFAYARGHESRRNRKNQREYPAGTRVQVCTAWQGYLVCHPVNEPEWITRFSVTELDRYFRNFGLESNT